MPDDILVIGPVMQDIIVHPEGPIRPGTDQLAEINICPGGAAANLSAWLAHFGVRPTLVGCVGETDRDAISAQLHASGIKADLMGSSVHRTGRLVALVDEHGERSFLTDRGANDHLDPDRLAAIDPAGFGFIALSGYAFLGVEARPALMKLIERARLKGTPVIIDPGSAGFIADVGAKGFAGWIAGCTYLLANEDEAALLSGKDHLESQLKALGAIATHPVVKLGAKGAACLDADGLVVRLPAQRIKALDSTGAGDAFAAAFTLALRDGKSRVEAVEAGVAAGTAACLVTGGRPG